MKLVDDAEEQRTLEELLDQTKPPVPAECAGLHYLLFTPLRYASRFRREGLTPPVFYASETVETAIAELAFWRLLFFAESPGTPWPANPLELTAFDAGYAAALCLDLTAPPYDDQTDSWRNPIDYGPCQAIADDVWTMGAQAIRTLSARAPGVNFAILTCTVFTETEPASQRTWRMMLSASGVFALAEAGDFTLAFDRGAFARDPRIAALDWTR